MAPISIRFERFTVFQTSASDGGHDFIKAEAEMIYSGTRCVQGTVSTLKAGMHRRFIPPAIRNFPLPLPLYPDFGGEGGVRGRVAGIFLGNGPAYATRFAIPLEINSPSFSSVRNNLPSSLVWMMLVLIRMLRAFCR